MLGPLVFAAVQGGLSILAAHPPRVPSILALGVAVVSIVGGILMWQQGDLPWFAPVFDAVVFGTVGWIALRRLMADQGPVHVGRR